MKKVMIGIMVLMGFQTLAIADSARFATLHNVQGDVSVQQENAEKWAVAIEGMVLSEMDVIKTSAESSVDVHLDADAETGNLHVREKSLLRLATMEKNVETNEKMTFLDLALGNVIVRAEKLQGDSKFEIRTPTSTTGVRGTVFEVSVEDADVS